MKQFFGKRDGRSAYILLFVLTLLFTWLNKDHFFFWDNVMQLSAPSNWYLDTRFGGLFVPDDIATGHPPLIPIYLALVWSFFGRTLLVSHLAMFPFRFGVLFQLYRLLEKAGVRKEQQRAVFLLVVVDAVFLSQFSLITFELPSLFFFLLLVNSLFTNNRIIQAIGFTFLCLTSLRGAIAGGGFILFSLIEKMRNKEVSYSHILKPYLPGVSVFAVFLMLFYLDKGWLVNNVNSGRWSGYASLVDLKGFLRNIIILFWRLGDYGNFIIWLIPLAALVKWYKTRSGPGAFLERIGLLAVIQIVVLLPFTVTLNNPFGHRYFLPVFVLMIIFAGVWILTFAGRKTVIYLIVMFTLATGNLWIYPLNISQGWDSTAAHWGYYKARREMVTLIRERYGNDVPVGTYFPNIESSRWIDLSEDGVEFREAETETDKLIFYSTIFNVSDEDIEALENRAVWKEVASSQSGLIRCTLYERIN